MEKSTLHHSPTRDYSHAWGETRSRRSDVEAVNRLTGRSVSPPAFPIEQLSPVDPGKREKRRNQFISLTQRGFNTRTEDTSGELDLHNSSEELQSRLSRLQNRLSDYRWEAETEIIDRTSDAVVHLDDMANEFRAGVRAELEKFRDETGDQSLLRHSLVDSALRRLSETSDNGEQSHHTYPSAEAPRVEPQQNPIFFNFLPLPETGE